MRHIIYRIFLILGFTLITVQLLDFISIYGERPDILLILVLFIAQKKGIMEGQTVGFLAGLMEDFFSLQLFGIHSFCKLIIGNVAGFIYNNFVIENVAFQFLLALVGVVSQGILFILAKAIFDNIDVLYYLKNAFWIKMLYTTLLAPLLFLMLDFLEKHFGEV